MPVQKRWTLFTILFSALFFTFYQLLGKPQCIISPCLWKKAQKLHQSNNISDPIWSDFKRVNKLGKKIAQYCSIFFSSIWGTVRHASSVSQGTEWPTLCLQTVEQLFLYSSFKLTVYPLHDQIKTLLNLPKHFVSSVF